MVDVLRQFSLTFGTSICLLIFSFSFLKLSKSAVIYWTFIFFLWTGTLLSFVFIVMSVVISPLYFCGCFCKYWIIYMKLPKKGVNIIYASTRYLKSWSNSKFFLEIMANSQHIQTNRHVKQNLYFLTQNNASDYVSYCFLTTTQNCLIYFRTEYNNWNCWEWSWQIVLCLFKKFLKFLVFHENEF